MSSIAALIHFLEELGDPLTSLHVELPSPPQRKIATIQLPWSFLPIREVSSPHRHPFSMALQRGSAFGGCWPLVPDQHGVQIRLSLLWGIQRLCWIGRCHLGTCGVRCGNEREGWFVLQLGRPSNRWIVNSIFSKSER